MEIVSRDRSTEYADAARQGAPQAIQVADRFHLIKNLGDALEPMLDRNKGCLRFTDEPGPEAQKDGQASPPQPPVLSQIRPAPGKKAEQVRLAQRQERLERVSRRPSPYMHKASKLQTLPHALVSIAEPLNAFSPLLVFLRKSDVALSEPNWRRITPISGSDGRQGSTMPLICAREITTLGYQGSYASVNKYLTCLRTGARLPATPMPLPVRTLTVKQARFLFFRSPTDLQTEERQDLENILSRSADLALIYHLAQQFREMLHHRRADQLDDWLQQALQCSCSELHSFVSGLRKDWKAVVTAFTLEWNNGMVEGHVNRLKLIKRQMYGRAEFDLLRQRVLHCA